MANEARQDVGGTALEVSGAIAEHDDCCCCPYTECSSTQSCCDGDPTPTAMDITLEGQDAACDGADGTYRTNEFESCTWTWDDPSDPDFYVAVYMGSTPLTAFWMDFGCTEANREDRTITGTGISAGDDATFCLGGSGVFEAATSLYIDISWSPV